MKLKLTKYQTGKLHRRFRDLRKKNSSTIGQIFTYKGEHGMAEISFQHFSPEQAAVIVKHFKAAKVELKNKRLL